MADTLLNGGLDREMRDRSMKVLCEVSAQYMVFFLSLIYDCWALAFDIT
jgi:hypothetical protein